MARIPNLKFEHTVCLITNDKNRRCAYGRDGGKYEIIHHEFEINPLKYTLKYQDKSVSFFRNLRLAEQSANKHNREGEW